jgi:hypothetical protein
MLEAVFVSAYTENPGTLLSLKTAAMALFGALTRKLRIELVISSVAMDTEGDDDEPEVLEETVFIDGIDFTYRMSWDGPTQSTKNESTLFFTVGPQRFEVQTAMKLHDGEATMMVRRAAWMNWTDMRLTVLDEQGHNITTITLNGKV